MNYSHRLPPAVEKRKIQIYGRFVSKFFSVRPGWEQLSRGTAWDQEIQLQKSAFKRRATIDISNILMVPKERALLLSDNLIQFRSMLNSTLLPGYVSSN